MYNYIGVDVSPTELAVLICVIHRGHDRKSICQILDIRKFVFFFKSVFMEVRFELTTSSVSHADDAIYVKALVHTIILQLALVCNIKCSFWTELKVFP